jgi:hypothetical protein
MSHKLVSIEYATIEEAAEVAAQLNAIGRRGAVRVRSEGRTLEVYSANASIKDLFGLCVKVRAGIVDFFKRSPDTCGDAVNELRMS